MPTKAQVETAMTRLVANEAKFEAWLNGDAEDAVELGEATVPTLAGIVGGFPAGANAGFGFGLNEAGGMDLLIIDQVTDTLERTRWVGGEISIVS